MSLKDAFDRLLDRDHPLDGIDDLVWEHLTAAGESSKHVWRTGGLVTTQPTGSASAVSDDAADSLSTSGAAPSARTVIVRRADASSRTIDCHTDLRSGKIDDLDASNLVAWLFYDHDSKIQLRLGGTAAHFHQGDEVDRAWQATPLASRSAYVTLRRPGVAIPGDRPPDGSDRRVDQETSERGRENFTILRTSVTWADWLYLRSGGHVRARVDYGVSGAANWVWLNP